MGMGEKRIVVRTLVGDEAAGQSNEWIEGAYRALIAQAKQDGRAAVDEKQGMKA